MSFGAPLKIVWVGKICELQVNDTLKEIDRSAGIIKEDIRIASEILKERFGIS